MMATVPKSAVEALATRRNSSTPVPTTRGSRLRNRISAVNHARIKTAETAV